MTEHDKRYPVSDQEKKPSKEEQIAYIREVFPGLSSVAQKSPDVRRFPLIPR
ncbi:MAG TPA: hypothetical protein VLF89_01275 [Candidatus Saccharimonadales bacterium]|nr:hypothetical protein [Candidatus Saccharimonadales bacterium]